MKTKKKEIGNHIEIGEKSFYIDKYNNFDIYNANINQESLFAKKKTNMKKFYYDNSVISQSYGQSNIEKCAIVITSTFFYTSILGYVYYEIFSNTKFYILTISIILDFFISLYFVCLSFSLKNEQLFQKVSVNSYSLIDILIFLNYLNKSILILFIFSDNSFYYLWCLIFFFIKFIFDTYFIMISLKFFMLSTCMIGIQEFFLRLWLNIKYYILCCEVEEPDHPDYTKMEELESFY